MTLLEFVCAFHYNKRSKCLAITHPRSRVIALSDAASLHHDMDGDDVAALNLHLQSIGRVVFAPALLATSAPSSSSSSSSSSSLEKKIAPNDDDGDDNDADDDNDDDDDMKKKSPKQNNDPPFALRTDSTRLLDILDLGVADEAVFKKT